MSFEHVGEKIRKEMDLPKDVPVELSIEAMKGEVEQILESKLQQCDKNKMDCCIPFYPEKADAEGLAECLMEQHRPGCKGAARWMEKYNLLKERGSLVFNKSFLIERGFMQREVEFLFSKSFCPDWEAMKFTRAFMGHLGMSGRSYYRGDCLILAGATITGKTIAAAWACNQAKAGRYVYSGDISENLRRQPGYKASLEKEPLLVLDDYAGDEGDQHYNRFIDSIFHKRHGNSMPTIITTNMAPDDFKKTLPERIASRLSKERGGWGVFVEVTKKSVH
ncbi:MAG: hypothetical protein Unbinned7913contig1002_5 [Prokaryotic dsDNA virus sp.]|jgi:uncharacterized protein YqgQ|nr:MAG: hypothetical protein Unbinned7913contig1002_5 [Prokaryotic dsDNA virus sp.]|tara:strand:+ start:5012 stop:5845 length:834 start_codon:yes stop_codon:yes gene_type:complete